MPLLVVRHAHAGSRSSWTGPDLDRPLSPRGMVQAFGIADQLEPCKPERILSSPFLRCRQTVEPLAGRLGLGVEIDSRLSEAASARDVEDVLDELAGAHAALCSHGDVIPELLHLLDRRGGNFAGELRWAKGSTWVVELDGDGVAGAARYLAPPDTPAEAR